MFQAPYARQPDTLQLLVSSQAPGDRLRPLPDGSPRLSQSQLPSDTVCHGTAAALPARQRLCSAPSSGGDVAGAVGASERRHCSGAGCLSPCSHMV